jgi:DNA-binding response OmpR family regulator
MGARILLVEDDPGIGTALRMNLEYEAYDVTWARDLRAARESTKSDTFDLVVMDRGLPDGDGLTLCRELRERGVRWPILVLTAQTDEAAVVTGLDAGANDYIRKPFGNQELLARVRTALGVSVEREDVLRFGDLVLSRTKRRARVGDQDLGLSPTEFAILLVLAENGTAVVTRERLMAHLDADGEITDRTLDSHLSHVRRKLRKMGVDTIQIISVYGIGYTLEKQ